MFVICQIRSTASSRKDEWVVGTLLKWAIVGKFIFLLYVKCDFLLGACWFSIDCTMTSLRQRPWVCASGRGHGTAVGSTSSRRWKRRMEMKQRFFKSRHWLVCNNNIRSVNTERMLHEDSQKKGFNRGKVVNVRRVEEGCSFWGFFGEGKQHGCGGARMDPRNVVQHCYLGCGGQLQPVKKGHTVPPRKYTVRRLL